MINAAALPRTTFDSRHAELCVAFYVSWAVAQTVTESDLRNVGFRDGDLLVIVARAIGAPIDAFSFFDISVSTGGAFGSNASALHRTWTKQRYE